MAIIHNVRYFTRKTPADAKARCTCGWFTFGSLSECQDAAASHDTEWQEVEVEQADRVPA